MGTSPISSWIVRVHVVDPSAYTPPYDRSLCGALARAGLDVTLVTSRFGYGDVPPADGFAVDERFYRGLPSNDRARFAAKLARHVPDMLSYRRAAKAADVVHFQWLTVQPVDAHLLPRRPLALTAHDILPREPRAGQLAAQRRLYDRVDAVVVHSEHGRARLVDELGLDPAKVELIGHGVLDALTHIEPERPPELPEPSDDKPVALFFGLLRPYKGVDVLLDAWRGVEADAELWIVGMPRMPVPTDLPPGVRVVPRFVSDAEAAWCMRQASIAVLPYREIDQSGVLFTALAFGLPLVLSDVGGFPEVGAAEHVPAGDSAALRATLARLLADPAERERLAAASRAAAATTYAWAPIARRHADLYARLTR